MQKWSKALTKNRVDSEIFEDVSEATPTELARIKDLKFYCEGVFETSERIKKVREIIKKKAKERPTSTIVTITANAILDELKEIETDLKFAKSRRGKFVLFANDWAQQVYSRLRKDARFKDLALGPSSEKETLIVYGSISDATALIDAIRILEMYDAGVSIEFRITLPTSNH